MVAKRGCGRWRVGFHGGGTLWFAVVVNILFLFSASAQRVASNRKIKDQSSISKGQPVKLEVYKNMVVMDNGIAQFSFSNPGGEVIRISYGGIKNLLDLHNSIHQRGYMDVNWNWAGEKENVLENVQGTKFSIIARNTDNVEISFSRTWDKKSHSSITPLIIDKRYIMRSNIPGLYSYAIFHHPQGWPGFELGQARVVYRLNEDQFRFMAISDVRQRFMPTASDRARGKPLAYPEAVLLKNPSNPQFRGEVDDKYQYSSENQDYNLHGWISKNPVVGFWIISPSNEFRTGGPVKQQLTCHVGPTALNMFVSAHYAGKEIGMNFADGEPWKKVFGPFLVYLNSNPPRGQYSELWKDASRQLLIESRSWPYNFITSDDFPASSQRGTVTGQLLIRDRYVNHNDIPAGTAYLGLAAPGDVGSWQTESKGYQFWIRADSSGKFKIENVRAGTYSLYGWVPGTLGDYKHSANVIVKPGGLTELGSLVYEPPRSGPTIWEIGIPDRTAAEFYVPDPSPLLTNKLYTRLKTQRFRQYGLWERYSELYPREDLVFTVGTSNFRKDWFFAHVTRRKGSTYVPTTWRINFELKDVAPNRIYTLQLALAAASISQIQVRFNDPRLLKLPLFTTKTIGSDNAIARHGIHGLYRLYSIKVAGNSLRKGINTLSLTQALATTPFQGVMYDYIRFESPPQLSL